MKITELLTESVLVESLMQYKEYLYDYYGPSFIEGVANNMTYAFNIGKVSGKKNPSSGTNFLGKIQNGEQVSRLISRATRSQDPIFALKSISFSVQEVNDDGEPTGSLHANMKLTNIHKDEKIKGALKPNLGNVSEIILGCAVASKFEKAGQEITVDDLIHIGQRLAENKGLLSAKAGKDTLTFKATVPFTDRKAFYSFVGRDSKGKTLEDYNVPQKTIDKLTAYVKSAVVYANTSKRVGNAVIKAQQDEHTNQVDVISDGGEKENQNVTKVDLKILLDGSNINLLSVKAGNVAQFGQVTGHNFENLNEFFQTTLGISLSDAVRQKFKDIPHGSQGPHALEDKEQNFGKAFYAGYAEALKQTKALANTNQAQLVKQVYEGLLHHLTKNEPGVEMVILNPSAKKAFSELSFGPEFKKAIDQLNLQVIEKHTDNAYYIEIYGYPATSFSKKAIGTSKEKLVYLWSSIRDGVIRNRVGMGNLLKDLADLENHVEQATQSAPVPADKTAPVAKARTVPTTAPNTTTATPATSVTPGIANAMKPLGASKIPMGTTPVTK
jgi:hypothetical protein